jgi:HAMP domain-containing protein
VTTTEHSVATVRTAYVTGLDDFEAAARELRQLLDRCLDAIPTLRDHVQAGRPAHTLPSEIADAFAARPSRAEVADALDNLERARRHARWALVTLLVSEGMSRADVGRLFGVSRSLISRIILKGP